MNKFWSIPIALFFAGCTLIPGYRRPVQPVDAQWPGTYAGTTSPDIGWRAFFADTRLQRLIELALANNRDLRVAMLNGYQEVDIVAILFTNGHIPAPKVAKRALELEIDLITTKLTLEEVQRLLKAEFGTTLEIKAHVVHP